MKMAQREPPPMEDPAQLSDMPTSREVNAVTVTLAETPSQSKAAESPSKTTRPVHDTRLLLAATVSERAGCDEAAATRRKSRMRIMINRRL
jgi:hypothetical protein